MNSLKAVKTDHLNQLADYRDDVLRKEPKLKFLFLELTTHCNEHCRHCGSSCGDVSDQNTLTDEEIKAFLLKTSKQFDISKLQLCITGGEPLLRKNFFDLMGYAHSLGYHWGMTTNGTLIDDEAAEKLRQAGMSTIAVSIDGLPETNDWFRQKPGGYDLAMRGVRALVRNGGFQHVQVTTVVHKKNIGELPKLYKILSKEGIRSWRVINMEPIGRANGCKDLLLDDGELKYMFDFIRKHRFRKPMEVTYGCSHYLGLDYEREVRKWYFLCNAGVYTASVMFNGDIGACLDIERRPETVMGNIRTDDFAEVWKNRFEIFRTDYKKQGPCADCNHYRFCAGGACHSWDYDENRPLVCMKGILF